MLNRLEAQLKKHGPLTCDMLARQLHASPGATEDMLNLLVARGKVTKSGLGGCGGGCCESANSVTLYEWQGQTHLPLKAL